MSMLSYPVHYDVFGPEDPGRDSTVDTILAALTGENPWDYDYAQLREVQLAAFNERLRRQCERIPMLAQRVDQLGIDEVASFEDAVPLLFAPSVYKSYPEAFVSKGRWPQLLRWLDGLSAERMVDQVNVEGVSDIDDFIDRLRAKGHRVVTTSGTGGKSSLMPESETDIERAAEIALRTYGTMWGVQSGSDHPFFYTGHRISPYRGATVRDAVEKAFCPSGVVTLFEEKLSVREVGETAALNKALANGTASPSDIARLRESQERARARADAAIDRFVTAMAEVGDEEPVYMWGQPFVFHLALKRARERGLTIRFHPDSSIITPGGLKNNQVSDNAAFIRELKEFYPKRMTTGYGSADMHSMYWECSQGRWHAPPTSMLVLTDDSGELLLNPAEGIAEGVFATFDFSPLRRWGGLVSTDWVTADFSRCPCGLASPSLLSVRRHEPGSGASDKLNCQGRIEMYIRGVVDDPADSPGPAREPQL